MRKSLSLPAERLRRSRREAEAFRRRSLARRTQARFRADLSVVPHLFLAKEALRTAPLRRPTREVLGGLRGKAVWTLDTAARLACRRGFLAARDLTGYLPSESLRTAVESGLIGEARPGPVSVDPIARRPPSLIAHLVEELPPFVVLASGDRVVTWDFLRRDILGTLGWRPDLLARLERSYAESAGALGKSLSRASRGE